MSKKQELRRLSKQLSTQTFEGIVVSPTPADEARAAYASGSHPMRFGCFVYCFVHVFFLFETIFFFFCVCFF
jgi:hypothetical protein